LRETGAGHSSASGGLPMPLIGFFIALIVSAAAVFFLTPAPAPPSQKPLASPAMMPLGLRFNKEPHSYHLNDPIEMWLEPMTPCLTYMFLSNEKGQLVELYPGYGKPALVSDFTKIEQAANDQLQASKDKMRIHLLACDPHNKEATKFAGRLIVDADWLNKEHGLVKFNQNELKKRVDDFAKQNPGAVFYHIFDAPTVQ
jgi:hypothetical protein